MNVKPLCLLLTTQHLARSMETGISSCWWGHEKQGRCTATCTAICTHNDTCLSARWHKAYISMHKETLTTPQLPARPRAKTTQGPQGTACASAQNLSHPQPGSSSATAKAIKSVPSCLLVCLAGCPGHQRQEHPLQAVLRQAILTDAQ